MIADQRRQQNTGDYLTHENAAGLVADFHANRHMFITNLSRAKVPPKVAQTMARHSDIRLTMNVYTHTDLAEQVDAVAKRPSFRAPSTATCDDPVGEPAGPTDIEDIEESQQR